MNELPLSLISTIFSTLTRFMYRHILASMAREKSGNMEKISLLNFCADFPLLPFLPPPLCFYFLFDFFLPSVDANILAQLIVASNNGIIG